MQVEAPEETPLEHFVAQIASRAFLQLVEDLLQRATALAASLLPDEMEAVGGLLQPLQAKK